MLSLNRLSTLRTGVSRPLVALRRPNSGLATSSANAGSAEPPPPPPPGTTKPAPPKTSKAKAASTTEPAAAAEGAETAGRRKRKYKIPTRRPQISLENPRKWNRPLAGGVVPAYDLALKYIRDDGAKLVVEATQLKEKIDALEAQYQKLDKGSEEGKRMDEELEGLREKLFIVEVQSEINLPDVRWSVRNAMADTAKPAHRHLIEKRWRKEGDLDLLMERVHQMRVVPDILPEIRPSVDLRLVVKADGVEQMRLHDNAVFLYEPGAFLRPKNTIEPLRLYANVFHTDTRLYTMMLVDPDVPDPENASYTTYLHWLKPNVPLSASHTGQILDLNTHTKYVPPHPQRGTPYHRYTLLLIPQKPLEPLDHKAGWYGRNTEARAQPGVPTSQHLDIPVIKDEDRLGFNVREFCKEWGLSAKRGGGVGMFREIWDEAVTGIYKDVLQQPEPVYGRPPKPDRYADLKGRKKYLS